MSIRILFIFAFAFSSITHANGLVDVSFEKPKNYASPNGGGTQTQYTTNTANTSAPSAPANRYNLTAEPQEKIVVIGDGWKKHQQYWCKGVVGKDALDRDVCQTDSFWWPEQLPWYSTAAVVREQTGATKAKIVRENGRTITALLSK